MKEIIEKLRHEENVLGCVLSGAGPAIIVFTQGNGLDRIRDIVSQTWFDLNVRSEVRTLEIEENGAVIL